MRTLRPRIRVLTLGVRDLTASTTFYAEGLGLPLRGIAGNDEDESTVAFFDLEDGLILGLFPQPWLSKEAKLPAPGGGGSAFSIGHFTTSKKEVDALVARARAAGAAVTAEPVMRVWGGYSGYFTDPDGHLWEIIWNPEYPEG